MDKHFLRSPHPLRLMAPDGLLGPLVMPPTTLFREGEDGTHLVPSLLPLLRPLPPAALPPTGLPPRSQPPLMPMQGPHQAPQRVRRRPGSRASHRNRGR